MTQYNNRRESILKKLIESSDPLKGTNLANEFGVTRQVIVKDIALLRAEGHNIIATPDGYIIEKFNSARVKKVIAVSHGAESIRDELEIVMRYGGVIEDVIVEHPLYGEIRGMLMIRNFNDLDKFMEKFETLNAQPLSILTGGVHIHTISAESVEDMNNIIENLKKRKYLIYE